MTASIDRFRKLRVAVLLGVGGVVCLGGVHVPVAAQEQPNACELLTPKEARKIIGKPVRRETNITGAQASQCSYTAARDAKRVLGLGVGELPSVDEATQRYGQARAKAQFDGLKIENVRRLGTGAYWLPRTNNFTRTIGEEPLAIGELTVLDGRRVYTVYLAPPSKTKARDTIDLVIAD
jgi:hypothetical protein